MSVVLKIDREPVASDHLLPLLAGYQLLPQLARELLIDRAIASVECPPEEEQLARKQFFERNQLSDPQQIQLWLKRFGMTQNQLDRLAVRAQKIETFKQQTWGLKLESYFLKRKRELDQVVYSLIRIRDADLANELYFRIQDGEATFAEVAQEHSQGSEAQTGGLVGPVYLSTPHRALAQILASSQPGQLWPPQRIEEWYAIVRLEKLIPAQLDDAMRRRLLDELFRKWIEEQIQQKVAIEADDSDAIASPAANAPPASAHPTSAAAPSS
ncbi:parvulin-like peptidyl-prolyl isomerase [Rubidibacter lacunae KORDI 51-2]|uniref:peptidylprolyl isomerase n=1 Tax=Rubidibacter lacunae KORDI 51-2 TaxID=582515 RepID=U5DNM0_9CHRO|nr:peptidylprolyl isomerase [Rubidibacter lacunae]ERN42467.1 parvulin-like peptidyl-prolyl isomerase [Rubidibacter lacunae KORDI 51-2]